ncbi:MAG TPA: hypothetical protein VL443_19125 [Cyclobacteriaceae bacterium]|jgi:hypothetical protein|nr:hypothetical protein [Cyclobacteriaceae bacterium]
MATVNITLSPTAASPDSASASKGDTIVWTPSGNNTITQITFNNPGIFKNNPAPVPGTNKWQGTLQSNAAHGKYKYSFVAGGSLVDPEIEINPPH